MEPGYLCVCCAWSADVNTASKKSEAPNPMCYLQVHYLALLPNGCATLWKPETAIQMDKPWMRLV